MRAYVIIPTVAQEHTTTRKLWGEAIAIDDSSDKTNQKSFHKAQPITTTNTTYREHVDTSTCIF